MIHHNLENIKPIDLVPLHLSHGGLKLLIWRDFDDWIASSIMKAHKVGATRTVSDIPAYVEKIVSGYRAIMREAKNPQYYNAGCVIHYDKFVKSETYRRDMCWTLGGIYSESMLNKIPRNGHYSSFDSDKFQGRGSEMNVLNRAKDILETPYKNLYLTIMKQYANRR
ncbi:MAG: hypothetical protein ACYTFW_24010 [Planctomycetota bacterium]